MPSLNARNKCFKGHGDFKVGDIVMIFTNSWDLPQQRQAVKKVQVNGNELIRLISKLCLLECELNFQNR